MSETNPQILVNSEQQQDQQQEQQQEQHQGTDAATVEEQISSVSLDDEYAEDSAAAEKEMQAKIQSVLHQVRNQIRSQVGTKAPKGSMLELVQRIKDREMEMAQGNSEPEGKDVSSEEKIRAEMSTDENKDEMALTEEELCATFEEKLKASEKTLRDEFKEQISQVRKEMQAYTDKALKDLECKLQSRQSHILHQTHPKEPQESKGPDKRQKPPVATSLASRRGRALTRTMTTIIPKTCAPVIIGPRAKSETLTSSKGESSRLLLRDPVHPLPGNKPYQSRKPLPPACPPLHQRKNTVWGKAKTGN